MKKILKYKVGDIVRVKSVVDLNYAVVGVVLEVDTTGEHPMIRVKTNPEYEDLTKIAHMYPKGWDGNVYWVEPENIYPDVESILNGKEKNMKWTDCWQVGLNVFDLINMNP